MIEPRNGFLPTSKTEALSTDAVVSITVAQDISHDDPPRAELTLMSGEPLIVHGPYAEAWLRYGGLIGDPTDVPPLAAFREQRIRGEDEA